MERKKPTPLDISQITETLYISALPNKEHADGIRALGIKLILSMRPIKPSRQLAQPPVRLLWLPTFDNPLIPISMHKLHRGVKAALPVIHNRGSVLCHCKAGVHRSVAMACCVLIGLGYSAEDAMALVKERRTVADPDTWYIRRRINKFEREWAEKP